LAEPVSFQERRWTSRDGLSLYAKDYAAAAGPVLLPVICLHGLTRNSRDFEDIAPHIAGQGRRVLALDMRGRGQSEWDPQPGRYTPTTYVADVLGLLDALGLARAIFIGTSMGGIITMALAAKRLDCIAASILNDVGPEIAADGVARIKSYVGGAGPIASWDDAAHYCEDINGVAFPDYAHADWKRFARRIFRDHDGIPRLDYDPAIAVQMQNGKFKASSFAAWLMFRRLARRRPTLLVRGALSDLLSSDIAQRMRKAAPNMSYVEVPNVGHAPMLSEPAAASAIDDFLAQLP
jgi:pimeloyl-ACP methyl ester carboxylesterase